MKKPSTVRIFASSILETTWATGVSGVIGYLSTKTHSSHKNAVVGITRCARSPQSAALTL